MGFRTVASANGILGIFFGISALALPATLAAIYGIEITDREAVVTRMLGAAYVALGLLAWAARGLSDASARVVVAQAQLTGWALTLAIVLPGLLAGYGNAVAWTIPVMQAAFALAWGSLLLRERMVR